MYKNCPALIVFLSSSIHVYAHDKLLTLQSYADRVALTRRAKANVKYDNCDAPDDNFFQTSQQHSKTPERRLNEASDVTTKSQLKETGEKGKQDKVKHAKSKDAGKNSRAQAAPAPVPASKRGKHKGQEFKDTQPPSGGWADGNENNLAQEVSVTVGAHASPQNPSPASLLKYIPDTNDTAAQTRAKAKSNAIQATKMNVRRPWQHMQSSRLHGFQYLWARDLVMSCTD